MQSDPYINLDPGTMNPYEHGEVFVTDDGGETDLDLGHYERFIDESLTRSSNATTGSIYQAVIAAERKGEYLGTVQVIPHITDEIKRRIERVSTDEVDVVITEVGGTVGDIEILRSLKRFANIETMQGRQRLLHPRHPRAIGPAGEQRPNRLYSVTEIRTVVSNLTSSCVEAKRQSAQLKHKISNMCDVENVRSLMHLMSAIFTNFHCCSTTKVLILCVSTCYVLMTQISI